MTEYNPLQDPKFPDNINDLNLESRLKQEIVIKIEFKNRTYDFYCTYTYIKSKNEDRRELKIGNPNIPVPPDRKSGLGAEFVEDNIINREFRTIKGHNDYYHNKAADKFFVEIIQPYLDEKLPKYMLRLTKIERKD